MESASSESTQKKDTSKPNFDLQVAECVRQFELPQQYPSTIVGLRTPKPGIDSSPSSLQVKGSQNVISSFPLPGGLKFIPNKEVALTENLQKLKLKLPNGRDLGEVKILRSQRDKQPPITKLIPIPKAGQNFDNPNVLLGKVLPSISNAKPKIKTVTRLISSISGIKGSDAQDSSKVQTQLINGNHHPCPNIDNQNETTVSSTSEIPKVGKKDARDQEIVVHNKNGDIIKKLRVERPDGETKTITLKKLVGSPKIVMLQKDSLNGKPLQEKISSTKPLPKSQPINFGIHRAPEPAIFNSPQNNPLMKKRDYSSLDQSKDLEPKKLCLRVDRDDFRDNDQSGKRDVFRSGLNRNDYQELRGGSSMVSSFDIIDQDPSGPHSEMMYMPTDQQSNDSCTNEGYLERANESYPDSQDSSFSILEKAVLSVKDATLRAKALQALKECGMKAKKTVPLKRPVASKMIIDSTTQTEVFSLLESEEFILVNEMSENLVRIKQSQRSMGQTTNIMSRPSHKVDAETDSQCLKEFQDKLDGVLAKVFPNSKGTSDVKDALLQSHKSRAKAILKQLKEDFESASKYDDDGWLGIHRAVMNDSIMEVQRHIIIMKAAKQNIDVCTQDDQTSLELAVEYEVNPQIVKVLLDAGAQPVSSKPMHDSAVHLAARTSAKILLLLLKYVNCDNRLLLNEKNIEGLAAIHYCAEHGNLEGMKELLKHGIDVNLTDDRTGRTALFYAIEKRNPSVPTEKYNEIMQALLDKGAVSNIPIFSKHTVLSLIDDVKNLPLKIALNKAIR